MKARAETLIETEAAEPVRGWGPGLVFASLLSWLIVIEAVRLVVALI